MFSGGLGFSSIPLSGWRSKHRPRELDAFDELNPKPAKSKSSPKPQNRAQSLLRRSKSVYAGVISHRPTPSPQTADGHVHTRRISGGQQSRWAGTSQSDSKSIISDDRHESRTHRAERGRLRACVTDDEEKAMMVMECPEEHLDRTLAKGPDIYEMDRAAWKGPRDCMRRVASCSLRWRGTHRRS
ncbi:hypothetical protein N7532_007026 [Penicillium argentinense]|uniref:Uncharacterized protein n=1 Tax=Penicillium argentinense TaxID=1131581 RepID=A0A9W9FGY3_9EURO|nr:uncharacterized protein N7532_007026 [Penicillium argentinense]KAJ5100025.1 hypothetical protein N7532_007026 [Penicillium argentinense]